MGRSLAFVLLIYGAICQVTYGAEDNTPEAAVIAYFAEFAKGDIVATARHIHSDELAKFKKMMMPTYEEQIEENSEVPDALREGDTLEHVRQYTPEEFFVFTLRSIWKSVFKDLFSKLTVSTLGHVMESDVAHVVYRMKYENRGVSITKVSVASVKKEKGQWKLLLEGEMKGMAQALRQKSSKE